MPDPTARPLLSESDLAVLVALWNAEKGYVGVELSGSWSAVAGSCRALGILALAISVLAGEPGHKLRLDEVKEAIDILQFYNAEARQGLYYYDVEKPDPSMAAIFERRSMAYSKAMEALQLLVAPRRELDDARDRQTERAGGER